MTLAIAPDAYGDLTLWDYAAEPPTALARECDLHPTVWRLIEATTVFTTTIEKGP